MMSSEKRRNRFATNSATRLKVKCVKITRLKKQVGLAAQPALLFTACSTIRQVLSNMALIDSSLLTLLMDSANNLAMLSCRILAHCSPASDRGMVSVTTRESMLEFSIFFIADPDNTGCVQ
jgi:predicted short-subunit dehydrogenase-like oxidoreductase (DUF2520 family)